MLITDPIYGVLGESVDAIRPTIRFNQSNLCPEISGIRFNMTIIESGDGYLVAFRNNWKHSDIYAARLTKDFKPTGYWRKLELTNGGASKGREDPRWFRIDGQLFINFVGFCGSATHMQYAKVNEDTLAVERIFWPVLYSQQRREKNWSAFEYQKDVWYVYSVNPHLILKAPIAEENCDPVVTQEYVTPFTGTWSGGTMRGGASPVLHNGNWLSFFHGHTTQRDGRRLYGMGAYEFSPKPPFQILRYTPEPIAVADPEVTPDNVPVDVIFPGGAVLVGDQWAIAMGVADLWSEIRFYDVDKIESLLVRHNAA